MLFGDGFHVEAPNLRSAIFHVTSCDSQLASGAVARQGRGQGVSMAFQSGTRQLTPWADERSFWEDQIAMEGEIRIMVSQNDWFPLSFSSPTDTSFLSSWTP